MTRAFASRSFAFLFAFLTLAVIVLVDTSPTRAQGSDFFDFFGRGNSRGGPTYTYRSSPGYSPGYYGGNSGYYGGGGPPVFCPGGGPSLRRRRPLDFWPWRRLVLRRVSDSARVGERPRLLCPRHDLHQYRRAAALPDARQWPGAALWDRRRARGFWLGRDPPRPRGKGKAELG